MPRNARLFTDTSSMVVEIYQESMRAGDDPNSIAKIIADLFTITNILQSRLAFLKAQITTEKASRRRKQTVLGNATEVSQTFYDTVIELWTAAQNYRIRVENNINKFFNSLAFELLVPPYNNPATLEVVRRQVLEIGEQLAPFCIIQMEIAEEQEKLDLMILKKELEKTQLNAELGMKLKQEDSEASPSQIQRRNNRLKKARIGRRIINSLLTKSNINYMKNPELVAMRIRWRSPVSF